MQKINFQKFFIYLFAILLILFGAKSFLKKISLDTNTLVTKSETVKWHYIKKSPASFKTYMSALNIHYSMPENISPEEFIALDVDKVMADVTHNYILVQLINFLYIAAFILFLFTFIKILQKEKHTDKEYKKHYLFAPLIFAVSPLLELYSRNLTEIKPSNVIIIISIISIFLYAIFLLLRLITKSNSSALVLTCVISIVLHFYRGVETQFDGIIYTSFILVLCFLINKIKPQKLGQIFFYTSMVIILMNVYQFTSSFCKNIHFTNAFIQEENIINKSSDRDIYLLILDQYPNSEYLKKLSGFDNNKFLNELRNRDFYVNDEIRSAYGRTRYAVPALLNLNYVPDLNTENKNIAISQNKLQKHSKEAGYYNIYINNVSDFDAKKGKILDEAYNIKNSFYINDCIASALSNSFYSVLIRPLNRIYVSDNTLTWEKLDYAINVSKRKFVVTHIMSPHEPYLHDKDGNNIRDYNGMLEIGGGETKTNLPMYVDYLIYTNNKTIEIVDKILNSSDKPPIIIIMGDHGIRHHRFRHNDVNNCNVLFREKDFLKSYFTTLFAYYNPEDNYKEYEKIETHLNFLRKISNNIFGTDYKPVKEKLYYVYMDQEHGEIDFNTHDKNVVEVTDLLK